MVDLILTFRWVGLKPIDHSAVEFFGKGVGFSWRAYRNLGTGYTCANSVMDPFVDTAGTTTSLIGFKEGGLLSWQPLMLGVCLIWLTKALGLCTILLIG